MHLVGLYTYCRMMHGAYSVKHLDIGLVLLYFSGGGGDGDYDDGGGGGVG